jgi:outer membrane protein assembly factor BamB/tetratricopeptide (TPR) repeat protein
MLTRFIAGPALAALLLAPAAAMAGAAPEDEKPEHGVTLNEEPQVDRLLAQAEKLAKPGQEQNLPRAIEIYRRIVEKYGETICLADRKEIIYMPTLARVGKSILSMPPEGLALYRTLCDGTAEALYRRGLARMDEVLLTQVAREYFATRWGDDALYALGLFAYDRGDYAYAAGCWRKVLDGIPDSSIPPAVLALRIMSAYSRSGSPQSKAFLATCRDRMPDDTVSIGGHDVPLLPILEKLAAAALTVETAGSARGRSSFVDTDGAPPVDVAPGAIKWTVDMVGAHLLPDAPEATTGAFGPAGGGRRVMVMRRGGRMVRVATDGSGSPEARLQVHPTIQDGRVYFATQRAVVCIDAASGKTVWSTEDKNIDVRLSEGGLTARHPLFVTVHGKRAYSVLGPILQPGQYASTGSDGTPRIVNSIVAVETSGGNRKWDYREELGRAGPEPPRADGKEIASLYFTTSPSAQGDTLYVGAVLPESGSCESWVVAIDAETGRRRWAQAICSAAPMVVSGASQPDAGLAVLPNGGSVYVVTNLGAVAALDASTGAIQWLRVYPRPAMADRGGGVFAGGGLIAMGDIWYPNPPLIHAGVLLVTPQDCPYLLALDPETGRSLWQFPRDNEADLEYCLGAAQGIVVFSGSKKIIAMDIRSGKLKWDKLCGSDDVPSPIGRGLVTADRVLIPVEKGILTFPLKTGFLDRKALMAWPEDKRPAGEINLSSAGDILLVTGGRMMTAYHDESILRRRLAAALEAEPQDPAPYLQLGLLAWRHNDLDEAARRLTQAHALAAPAAVRPHPETFAEAARFLCRLYADRAERWIPELTREDDQPAKAAMSGKILQPLETALRYAIDPADRIRARFLMARVYQDMRSWDRYVDQWQAILAEAGGALYRFDGPSGPAEKASRRAEREIAACVREHGPLSYALFEAEALALSASGADADLRAVVERFPNASCLSKAILDLSRHAAERGDVDESLRLLREHLRRFRDPASAEGKQTARVLAEAGARLIAAGRPAEAREFLWRLERLAGVQVAFPGDPGTTDAAERARALLASAPIKNAHTSRGPRRLRPPVVAGPVLREDAGGKFLPFAPSGAAPAGAAHVAFFYNGASVYAYNTQTWKLAWNPRPVQNLNGMTFSDAGLLLIHAQSGIDAIEPLTGAVVWSWSGRDTAPPLATDDSWVVFLNATRKHMTVLSAASGKVLWEADMPTGRVVSAGAAPVMGEGFIALRVAEENGSAANAVVFDAATGENIRQHALAGPGAPVAIGLGMLFAAVGPTEVAAYSLHDGAEIWHARDFAAMQDASARLAVLEDRLAVFFGGGKTIAIVDPLAAGKTLWPINLEGVLGGWQADGEVIAAVDVQGSLKACVRVYNVRTGKFFWSTPEVDLQGNAWSGQVWLMDDYMLEAHRSGNSHGAAQALLDKRNGKRIWDRVADVKEEMHVLQPVDGCVVAASGKTVQGFGEKK